MHVQLSHRDYLVRAHFDNTTALYVDVHRDAGRIICQERIAAFAAVIDPRTEAPLKLADVGCGGGAFTDAFLAIFPNARSFALDMSAGMLKRNLPGDGKRLIVGDARALPLRDDMFDVLNVDAVLHHLVAQSGYEATIDVIRKSVVSFTQRLKPGGVLLVRELYHESWVAPTAATKLIWFISTRSLPAPIAALLRWAGLKTANVGVCFLSRDQWKELFAQCGLVVLEARDKAWAPSWLRWAGIRHSGEVHYILHRTETSTVEGME